MQYLIGIVRLVSNEPVQLWQLTLAESLAVGVCALLTSGLVTAPKSTPRKTKPLPLEDIIPFEEHEAAGLNKLSNAERDYLAKLLIEKLAAAYQAARIAAPNPARLSSPTAPTIYSAVVKGHWIKTNIDSGTFIQLEDESLWEIDPPGQVDASLWLSTRPASLLSNQTKVRRATDIA